MLDSKDAAVLSVLLHVDAASPEKPRLLAELSDVGREFYELLSNKTEIMIGFGPYSITRIEVRVGVRHETVRCRLHAGDAMRFLDKEPHEDKNHTSLWWELKVPRECGIPIAKKIRKESKMPIEVSYPSLKKKEIV